jgi:endonuclease/exonuclease/phosphatase (EEP) superfamily protein YafD
MAQLSLSTLLEGKSMTAPELQQQLYDDLSQEIRSHQSQKRKILLTGDFNATVFDNKAKEFLDSLAVTVQQL